MINEFLKLKTKFNKLLFLILVSFGPILSVLSINIKTELISIREFLQTYLIILIIFTSIILIIRFVFLVKNEKLFILSSVLFLFFFQFRAIEHVLFKLVNNFVTDNSLELFSISLVFWLIFNAIIILILKKYYNYKFQKLLVIFFTVIFIFNLGSVIVNSNLKFENSFVNDVFKKTDLNTRVLTKNPNIYFIISDMFPSSEYLKILYDDDNENFLEFFKKNKFKFKDNHFSNYSNTFMSLASLFNTNYLRDDYFFNPQKFKTNSNFFKSNNTVGTIFEKNGFETNYFICKISYFLKGKYCYKNTNLPSVPVLGDKFINGVFYHTLLDKYFLKAQENQINESMLYPKKLDELFEFNKKTKQFNFLHFYFPHPPYLLNSDCSFRENLLLKEIKSNNIALTEYERKKGYLGNVKCAKSKILNLLEKIIKKDENAFIIFLGDHGPHLIKKSNLYSNYQNLLDKNGTFIGIKYSKNLNHCNSEFDYRNLNHVNLFRLVFNCISKDQNEYLENKIYFHDVTNKKLKSKVYSSNEIKTMIAQ